jgi:hypothetical protein
MLKRITWISWVALALMVVGIVGVVLFSSVKITPPISDRIIDYEYVLILPLAMLSSYAFIIFLVKAKKMPAMDKSPWISFSVGSFLYLASTVFHLFRYGLYTTNPRLFEKILPNGISEFCLVFAIFAILYGFIAEVRTSARNLLLSNYLGIYALLYISTSLIEHFFPIGAIIRIVLGLSIPSVFCIYVINSIGKEPKAICYKVLLAGFIASTVIGVVCYLLKTDVYEPILALVNLFCVVVATDIRTQIWLEESSAKALPETEEIKC